MTEGEIYLAAIKNYQMMEISADPGITLKEPPW
jgi:hypothetical protein